MKNDKPLIILDRDGVINFDSDAYIKTVEEFIPIPGSLEAIATLNKAGYRVVVVTNQSGIARGYYNVETLQSMHKKLTSLLDALGGKIEKIYYCPHGPTDGCECRKPKPGMLQQALRDMQSNAANAIMIGDSISDLAAAEAAGVSACLVSTGKGERSSKQITQQKIYSHVAVYTDLSTAVSAIVSGPSKFLKNSQVP
ncbi:MAG: D-glycero-beta-D-manno-heptose 1,7-bisphosphate 7-phosphatase [Thiohalomonadales bacterium]